MKFYLVLVIPFLLIGCAKKTAVVEPEKPDSFKAVDIKASLSSISIIDRNGLSETITSKERLNLYRNVDFISSQPYQKVMRVFAKDKEGVSCSVITSYHENGQIKQYLEAINSRAKGTYCEWHTNGQKKLLARLIAGIADIDEKSQNSWSFDKVSYAWDSEGRIITEIPYNKGETEGLALYYHIDGAIAKEIPYSKSEINGELKVFLPDSTLIECTAFKDGVQHGDSVGFWASNTPSWKECFEEGLLKSGAYFNKNNELIASIEKGSGKRCIFDETGPNEFCEYKDGKAEGEVTILENNQHLICRYFLKNGEKHGEEMRYYLPKPFDGSKEQNLTPKLAIQWYEGKIHGLAKTWYENGALESQREMSQNLKQGHLSAWYKNGSLMLIEEYEKNKLVRGEYLKKDENSPISKVEHGKGIAMLYDSDGNFNVKVRYQDGKPLEE